MSDTWTGSLERAAADERRQWERIHADTLARWKPRWYSLPSYRRLYRLFAETLASFAFVRGELAAETMERELSDSLRLQLVSDLSYPSSDTKNVVAMLSAENGRWVPASRLTLGDVNRIKHREPSRWMLVCGEGFVFMPEKVAA